ncbi:unnamed protein product [Mytilus coruscus]|uniref:Transglutaminase-like domain-containing protein n=1 Tax=Mytilus coruscus TaxID=42192 RepID=A0A6J8C287_MYTCO|nr:unnamed protein product [Mytilus coruscus]
MGCMVSGRVEPVAAHESRVDIPNQSATLKQVLEENKQIKHKEKKRKKKKRKTDRQYLPLVEDSQQKNKTSKVKIENFGEDQVPKKENVTTATDSSTTLPSKTRLHSKENTGENRQNMTNSDQETVTKCKKKKKKRRRKEKQTINSERTNEENNDFKNSLDKDEDKRPDTKDEEKRTQFENAAGTKDIYDNILKESKIYPAEENSYTEVIKMSEEKKKEKDASSYQSQNNENQNDVLVRKETDFRETSNVKLTEADKRQVDYINNHAKETEKTQPLQKKEGGVFRDVRRRDNSVIIYQNTNDKEKWNFLHIDSHALQAPRDVELSVETLANYLSKPVHATLETVRAFFVWITNNIRYDTDALESDRIAPSDPQDVLKLKTCVCAGYAKLFEALCSFKGVEVKCINGYSKGYKYSAEKIFTLNKKEDHAWNAVKINENGFL